MPRRGDNIHKRKDGRWEARYIAADCPRYKSVYGKTYREAKQKRDALLKQAQQQCTVSSELLFGDILEAWQAANRVRLKPASISRYQNLIDSHILPALGNKRISQINASTINQFLATKLETGRLNGEGGLSASYVRSIMLIISSALRYAVSQKLCAPLHGSIVKPALPKKALPILDAEKQLQLETELLAHINEEKLLIYLTLYTGLRIGEACALRWEDVNLDTKLIYVRQTISRVWRWENGKKYSSLIIGSPKTESSLRYIPICSKLYTVLVGFSVRKRHGFVLPNTRDDGFISPRTFEYRYKKILESAKLTPINYHALRHTFATRCIERGVDIKSLSEILGHADASVTLNTYVHASIDLKRMQLEKLA